MNKKSVRIMGGIRAMAMLMLFFAASAIISQAQVLGEKPWTTIGSAGTVDEGDEVSYTDNIAFLVGEAAVIRYNVVAVDGLFEKGNTPLLPKPTRMTVRFRDNGDNNHLIVRLKRVSLTTGDIDTLLTLDSNNYAGSSSFQTRTVGCGAFDFDFSTHAYYVEATMTRTGLPITTALASIQIAKSATGCLVAPQ
jgi:hypothetical protein